MSVEIKWHGDRLQKAIGEAAAEGLIRCASAFHADCRIAVSKSNPRNPKTGENDKPSAPGEPPRLRTGFGRENIIFGFNGDMQNPATRVGVRQNGIYMYWLELGFTRRMMRIVNKSGGMLRIPWRGQVQALPPSKRKGNASSKSRYLAIPQQGDPFIVYKESGQYFYFRPRVTVPPTTVLPRPWMLSTLRANEDKYAQLAAIGGQQKIQ